MSKHRRRGIATSLSVAAVAIALAISILPGVAAAQPLHAPAAAPPHHDRVSSGLGYDPASTPAPEASQDPASGGYGGPAASAPPAPTDPNAQPAVDPNAESLVYQADMPDQITTGCDADQPDCTAAQPKPDGGNEGDDVNARLNWFINQRAYPNLTVPNGALSRAQQQAAHLPIARSHAVNPNTLIGTNTSGVWTSIGPKPIQISSFVNNIYNGKPPVIGRVTSIAAHPTNANIVYIGTAFGGVWKTTNGGTSWTPIFDSAGSGAVKGSLSIGAIAISKTDPNTIYVGTGEANSALDNYFGNGVYKSTDGGAHWAKTGGTRFDGCGISRIVIDASNANIVYVATRLEAAQLQVSSTCSAGNGSGNGNPGLHMTANGGSTWATVLCCANASDVVSGVSSPGTVYAAFDGGFLWKGTNHGASWNQITNGPPASSTTYGRTSLAVSANGKILYVAQAQNSNNDLAFGSFGKSTDGGATAGNWHTFSATTDFCNLGTNGQCWYDLTLAVNPNNVNQLFAGGIYQNRCTGTTCVKIANGPTKIHVDYHALTFDASGRLWAGNDGGVYRSDDGGTTWHDLNGGGLAITQLYPGVSGTPTGVLLAGAQDNGSLRYTPATKWHEFSAGDGGFTAIDPKKSNIEYNTYPNGVIYQSLNGGASPPTWIDAFNSGSQNVCSKLAGDYCQFIFPMVMDPTNHHRLYAGSRYLWRGTGTPGNTATAPWHWGWQALNTTAFSSPANVIAPAPSNANIIYVATVGVQNSVNPQLLYSSDGGAHFTARTGLPNRFVSDIYVDPANPANIWVTFSGFGTDHVYKSTNSGSSWQHISTGLPNAPVGAIVVDTRPATPLLYIGTDVGVFRSTNNGTSWAKFGTGLPNSVVMDLTLDRAHNTLVAATHGRGVFVTGQ
jgi:hypothetical protein